MRIYLIGFMGSGKTSTGRKLAEKLNYEFLDTDHLFEERFHMSIPNFFKRFGEEKFRELEHQILASHVENEHMVLSTGGGTPCFHNNIQMLKHHGTVVYLKMEAAQLYERLKQSRRKRPLISEEQIDTLYDLIETKLNERKPFYEQAHITVDANHINIDLLTEALLQSDHRKN